MFLNKRFWFVALSIIAVLLASTLQSQHVLGIFGIRPNLILAVLVALCFYINNLPLFCLLVILACVGIRFESGISIEPVALALVSLAAFLVKERAVWPGASGTGILIGLGTVAMNAMIAPVFLYRHSGVVLFEAVYTIVLGLIFYEIISLYVKKTRLTI